MTKAWCQNSTFTSYRNKYINYVHSLYSIKTQVFSQNKHFINFCWNVSKTSSNITEHVAKRLSPPLIAIIIMCCESFCQCYKAFSLQSIFLRTDNRTELFTEDDVYMWWLPWLCVHLNYSLCCSQVHSPRSHMSLWVSLSSRERKTELE